MSDKKRVKISAETAAHFKAIATILVIGFAVTGIIFFPTLALKIFLGALLLFIAILVYVFIFVMWYDK